MNTIDIALTAGVFLSIVFCALSSGKLWNVSHGAGEKGGKKTVFSIHMVSMLPVLVMCFIHIPLPVFYILLYAADCIPQIRHRKTKEEKNREALLSNVWFLMFSAPHLVMLGLMALLAQTDVVKVLTNTQYRMFSLGAIALLAGIISPVVGRYLGEEKLQPLYWNAGESYLFSRFAEFCVLSVILDSIPCLFPLRTTFSIFFLIGSNFLLLLMVALFADHVYGIIRVAHLKDEYLSLQEEALRQHSRTVELEQEAYIDDLTRSYTRAYAMLNLNELLRGKERFVLAFLDLDGLKKINDSRGHLAGDAYLKKFAECIKSGMYLSDIFARYGGDEFLILMPNCPLEAADSRLTKLQINATENGFPFSYGIVQVHPEKGLSAERWIAKADSVMYDNKRERRGHREGEQI